MPDNDPREDMTHQAKKSETSVPMIDPVSPEQPNSATTQPVANDSVTTDVKDLEGRIRRAEVWMIGLTAAIAFFGLCAVIVGTLQWCAMRGQLAEMGRQGTLMHQQLVGTEAAIVNVLEFPNIESPNTGNFGFNIALKNDGHVTAGNVHLALTAQIMNLPSMESVGELWKCDPPDFLLAGNTPKNIQCFLNGLNTDTWQPIKDFKQTIAVDGAFSYDNGFGETIHRAICLRYIPTIKTNFGDEAFNRFEACERIPALMEY